MQLTIVGLGVVGTSLGMALKATDAGIVVMGHDPEAANVKRAKKLGAIDKSHWNLIGACEEADLLVFDLPLAEVEKTLAALQGYLKESTVIIDMAPVKKPVFEAAQRLLPQVPLIGGHVVSPRLLTADAEPSAELVNGATFYIVAQEDAKAAALDTATNLALAVGAKPQFIDVQEHDGLVAATLELPLLGALALMRTVAESAGWQDRVKSVGGELATVGTTLLNAPPGMMDMVLSNREDVLRWL
ncbi:MAG: prephenate dehydrogenase, partial [Chloroflexi bacterium]|nr:prephenate dehydrogenase [Chloroflexota bacterium]